MGRETKNTVNELIRIYLLKPIGNLITGNIAATGTITASSHITSTAGNVVASAGNISATAGSVSAGTTVTATLGAITATNGNLVLGTAGNGINIKEGANGRMGVVTLVAGTATIATTAVTATSRIILSIQVLGTVAAAKAIAVTARNAGQDFTITSEDNTDTSDVAWIILEPAA